MIFVTNKILVDEILRLREDNAALKTTIFELIDKFVHNRSPERLVKREMPSVVPTSSDAAEGMGDPLSVAERDAWEKSKPREDADAG